MPTYVGTDWVYLAGPMSGIADHNHPAFNAAALALRAEGFKVINPAEFDPHDWHVGMRFDVRVIADHCDKIAILDGFEVSKGANVEMLLAMVLNLDFIAIPGQTVRHVAYRRIWAQTSLVTCWRKVL